MADLAQWLTAQLDADAARATAAADETEPEWSDGGPYGEGVHSVPLGGAVAVGPWTGYLPDALRAHIAEHDPARVLREIEAKRKLLALLPDLAHADRMIEGEWGSSDDLAEKLLDALLTPYPKCGATTVFWPEDEACDAVCVWPRGHGGVRHIDETLGEWDEEELATSHPSE